MTNSQGDETYYFLEDDLERLKVKVAELEKTYKETLSGAHDSTTQSSETWHDNPAFDEVQQRSRMFHNEFRKMKAILDLARPAVDRTATASAVGIGSRVSVVVNGRTQFDVVVCSYRCFHESADDTEYVSYVAPLAAAILGKHPGETGSYRSGERVVNVEVLRVQSALTSEMHDE